MGYPPPVSVVKHIASKIRDNRHAMGLTQSELGERFGNSQAQVSQWENGHVCPGLETLYRMARVFGCTVHDLLPAVQ